MARQRYMVGNWKMNHQRSSIEEFFKAFKGQDFKGKSGQIWIAPQAIHLAHCLPLAREVGIAIGAQNCSPFKQGAYTGEISPGGLKEMGAKFTLIGHSERRLLFGESPRGFKEEGPYGLGLWTQGRFLCGGIP